MVPLFLDQTILKSKENGKIAQNNNIKLVYFPILILGVKVV